MLAAPAPMIVGATDSMRDQLIGREVQIFGSVTDMGEGDSWLLAKAADDTMFRADLQGTPDVTNAMLFRGRLERCDGEAAIKVVCDSQPIPAGDLVDKDNVRRMISAMRNTPEVHGVVGAP
eukprot:TRINITY_DN7307_c0_g1_i1.p1 TRINITY_DN7307_c0_g1~~TRINITY_DN7307_c0_g1_i1.p1  ORF type:complete len:121 (+),score=35.89 TRINITY_DN7307_c0_g1_i1:84-446(+)